MSSDSFLSVPFSELISHLLECRFKISTKLDLIIFSFIFFIIFNTFLYCLIHIINDESVKFRLFRRLKLPEKISRTLLVTAHPDDESMFFGPTLLALKKRKDCSTFLLCLSTGDYDKQGQLRKQELWDSCQELGIKPQNITMFNCTLLPDDPVSNWKSELLSDIIQSHVEMLDIDLLITFDRDGISQHKNHQAIYFAVASLYLAGTLPKRCKVLVLSTVNTIRKYLSFFDIFVSLILSSNWTILKWNEMKIVQSAMNRHKSQMLWFRKLYIRFSRYMIINTLTELNRETIQFDFIG